MSSGGILSDEPPCCDPAGGLPLIIAGRKPELDRDRAQSACVFDQRLSELLDFADFRSKQPQPVKLGGGNLDGRGTKEAGV